GVPGQLLLERQGQDVDLLEGLGLVLGVGLALELGVPLELLGQGPRVRGGRRAEYLLPLGGQEGFVHELASLVRRRPSRGRRHPPGRERQRSLVSPPTSCPKGAAGWGRSRRPGG